MKSWMSSSIVVAGVVALGWIAADNDRPKTGEVVALPVRESTTSAELPKLPPITLPAPPELAARVDASSLSHSGVLRVRMVMPGERFTVPLAWEKPRPESVAYRWIEVLSIDGREAKFGKAGRSAPLGPDDGVTAPDEPGVYRLELTAFDQSLRLDDLDVIVKVPFNQKKGGYLKGYLIGTYPTERQNRTDRYAPPVGFIEVTKENQSLRLSEHFTLREFLTKNQRNVWPKYVVVDPLLLDKLELVMQDLNARGIRADRMVVMSGYRTPQYNRQGLNQGRASLSRHQYGDAADVWVDNDGDWYMDDLNGDGRRNTGDARVILESVDRVEARHPELVGGAGIYPDNGVHGPFIHIDVRGRRARW